MKKALRDKRIAFWVSFFSLVFAAALTFLAVLCLKETLYVAMVAFALVSAVFYYVFVFKVYSFLDAKSAVRLLEIMKFSGDDSQLMKITEISKAMGWQIKTTKRFIERCRRKGYIGWRY